jgi:REP element-mobilizing transposase RayT
LSGCITCAPSDGFANVLANHLHLITEASSKQALARGIQGFSVRVARRVNSALNRSGKLVELERPNARPQTWLLSIGWRRGGLLRLDDAPA